MAIKNNKNQIIINLRDKIGGRDFFDMVKQYLKEKGKVLITDFGTFSVKEIPGRETYNPKTGGKAYMKPYKKIKFSASTKFYNLINK